jgi:hypothetical protein
MKITWPRRDSLKKMIQIVEHETVVNAVYFFKKSARQLKHVNDLPTQRVFHVIKDGTLADGTVGHSVISTQSLNHDI